MTGNPSAVPNWDLVDDDDPSPSEATFHPASSFLPCHHPTYDAVAASVPVPQRCHCCCNHVNAAVQLAHVKPPRCTPTSSHSGFHAASNAPTAGLNGCRHQHHRRCQDAATQTPQSSPPPQKIPQCSCPDHAAAVSARLAALKIGVSAAASRDPPRTVRPDRLPEGCSVSGCSCSLSSQLRENLIERPASSAPRVPAPSSRPPVAFFKEPSVTAHDGHQHGSWPSELRCQASAASHSFYTARFGDEGSFATTSVNYFGAGRPAGCCSEATDEDEDDDDDAVSSCSYSSNKPHSANDARWEAIRVVRARYGALGLSNFRVLRKLGSGDIGCVYLAQLVGAGMAGCRFAIKVMDKAKLAERKKLARAQTEREILQSLDHPFLPTLYSYFENDRFSCLVMEFCPGGDLHQLRQRQPNRHFSEKATRFYVAEVLLALEYLHMLGIIYRDLKPENVLVREDGHIMLSDFDLSLRCLVSPILMKSSKSKGIHAKNSEQCIQPSCMEPAAAVESLCLTPRCFTPRFLMGRSKKSSSSGGEKLRGGEFPSLNNRLLPELVAEPTNARSMSFVGTHEYLAPEIIKGEGHGSAVDWWTLGVFLYELLYGQTPFRGTGNRATLFNVVGEPLRFPETPAVSLEARDLIRRLLVKDPQHRLAYRRGAAEVKRHPFFQSVNWALIRCAIPPEVPRVGQHEVSAYGSDSSVRAYSTSLEPSSITSSGNYYEMAFF